VYSVVSDGAYHNHNHNKRLAATRQHDSARAHLQCHRQKVWRVGEKSNVDLLQQAANRGGDRVANKWRSSAEAFIYKAIKPNARCATTQTTTISVFATTTTTTQARQSITIYLEHDVWRWNVDPQQRSHHPT
jgi:hypothetical protein